MATKTLPPRELVRQLLDYDPETGEFIWRERHFADPEYQKYWNWKFSGQKAGSLLSTRYLRISINDISYHSHRLAWLYVYGDPVPRLIDHADRDRSNNRIGNLRASTPGLNMANSIIPRNNTSGVKGVRIEDGKFRARIMLNGKLLHLGCFNTIEEAALAYREAAIRLFGEFARWSDGGSGSVRPDL